MNYLMPTEYVQYGLTAETTDDWVVMFSALIDTHCRRATLLVNAYTERLRLAPGSQSVRLSYRPLAAADGASSPLVSIRVHYGRPRRGEAATSAESIAGSLEGSLSVAASNLFASAYGVMVDQVLMTIDTVASSDVGGSPCVYRLLLRRPIGLTQAT